MSGGVAGRAWRGGRGRGTAAVGVIIALVLLQLAVVAAVLGGARQAEVTARVSEGMRATYGADTATALSLREIARNVDEDGDGAVGGVASNTVNGRNFGGGTVRAAVSGSGTLTVSVSGVNGLARRGQVLSVRPSTGKVPGVYVEYWTLTSGPGNVGAVSWSSTPTAAGIAPNICFASTSSGNQWLNSTTRFAGRFRGEVYIPTAGAWTFYVNSDDGSVMWVNGAALVSNDGAHGMTERSGTVTLSAGWATVEVQYWDQGGSAGVIASWAGPGVAKQVIPWRSWRCSPARPFPAFIGNTRMTLAGDSSAQAVSIDGYDPGAGAYSAGSAMTGATIGAVNSTSAGAMGFTGKSMLLGNALVGVGGNPATVVSPTASVTGTATAQTVAQALTRPTPDVTPTSLGALSSSGTTAISGTVRYSSVALSGSGSLQVSGDAVLIVDGAFQMAGSSTVVLNAGATLRMYVGGTVTASNDSVINSGGDPARVLIVMTGASQAATVTDRAQVYAELLNPRGAFSLTGVSANTARWYGAVRAGTIDATNKTELHGDVRPTRTSSGVAVLGWAEGP